MLWFIVLLLLAGAGFYFYQKMMTIEREIRAEQAAEKNTEEGPTAVASNSEEDADPQIVTAEIGNLTASVDPVADASYTLEDEILEAISNLPGIRQSELYDSFSDVSKKRLQQLLKQLADDGQLKREKQGSSYLLYPV
ncbi:MAG: hypothetical protein GXP51_04830 [Deltaproteobacteria bacterium]|nr:hypothetical protein [Deltaproteobacteria bacterium]